MFFDRMALLLNAWNALLLGILYLAFQAFPIIFEQQHGFTVQETGMSFLGIGVGMIMGISSQPLWNRCVMSSVSPRCFAYVSGCKTVHAREPEIRREATAGDASVYGSSGRRIGTDRFGHVLY